MKLYPSNQLDRSPFSNQERANHKEAAHPYRLEEIGDTLATELGSLSLHTYDSLTVNEAVTPQVKLADSLDKLEHGDLPSDDVAKVLDIAEKDAKELTAATFPPEIVEESGIAAKLESIPTRPNDSSEYVPPSLKDLLLIARACDDLQDPELLYVLHRIVEGDVDKAFKQAVQAAGLTGGPIMPEYYRIVSQIDNRLEKTVETRGFIDLMRLASQRPIPHIERQIRRSKDTNSEDMDVTGYQS